MILHIPPPEFLSDPALRAVLTALPDARLVGGCVRDAIAGIPVADIDLATPLPPDQVIAALQAAGLRAIPTGLHHGTITAISAGQPFEITTLRRDVATDGRHATVRFDADWAQDAARRDFTFNALSMTPDGTVHDLFDGVADLRAGRVRFVGDPATRLAEDRLRALRYFRFHARFAAAPPDDATQAALRAVAPHLHLLSAERIAAELKRILEVPNPMDALQLMQRLGILSAILPEATHLDRLAALIEAAAPPDPLLRLAALTTSRPSIHLSGAEAARLDALHTGPVPTPTDDDATLRRLLADTTRDILIDRTWLAGAPAALRQRLAALPIPVFPVEGRDLLARFMPPGPHMGETLRQLRAWWLQGGCVAGKAACLAHWPSVSAAPMLAVPPRPSLAPPMSPLSFQDLILRLHGFWAAQGCVILQPYDMEMGAGTFHPATALRALGPKPWRAAYVQPSRRPSDGRYGDNPNRLQHFYQYQVIMKPSPAAAQDLLLNSYRAIGLDPALHDIRFVEDDWESPTLGAWGLGWEVWCDGMEVGQFTYFQQVGGISVTYPSFEMTYGLERLAMYVQGVERVYDLDYNGHGITYGDVFLRAEKEYSAHNFEFANTAQLTQHFADAEAECAALVARDLALPAYDQCIKASHLFNLLDARGVISVAERASYIGRVRTLAKHCCEAWVAGETAVDA